MICNIFGEHLVVDDTKPVVYVMEIRILKLVIGLNGRTISTCLCISKTNEFFKEGEFFCHFDLGDHKHVGKEL